MIGLIPEQNVFKQLERYEPLAAYVSQRAGLHIKLKILPRYGNIIDNFKSAGMDGAFFGSFTYALAHERLAVDVLARPLDLHQRSTYYGVILVRKDSGIRTIEDMKGKRFAFVDKATMAGYLLPLDFFHRRGVRDYAAYLGETYFAGTHEGVIEDVVNGRADIGAAKNTVLERLVGEHPGVAQVLEIIERSPDVPENGLAVRHDLEAPLRESLKKVLLTMHTDPDGRAVLRGFGALRFIETTEADYEPVRAYAREIGLDLRTYDYDNQR